MIAAAQEAAPEVDPRTVERILSAAMPGTFVLEVDAGEKIVGGKSFYPARAAILFTDPLRALGVAQEILISANNALMRRETKCALFVHVPGEATFED
jgi:hypothetical protein